MARKDTGKKVAIGVGVAGVVAAAIFYFMRDGELPPPPEGYGRIQGYIVDNETGAKVANAEVLVDGTFHCYSDYHGLYRTGDIKFGTYVVTVNANNYQSADFDVKLEQTVLEIDLNLSPLPLAPTDWTEGVEIVKITVEPSLAYVGETVNIDVYIQYPYPLEVPADIHGTVLVDGSSIEGQWTITFRNPTLRLQYTTTTPGDFVARALDKSAGFRVQEIISIPHYSPFGGGRMPICTQVTIPNVEPFESWGQKFEGGDFVVDGFSELQVTNVPQLIEGLKNAYPSKWDPPGAEVNNWVTRYRTWSGGFAYPSGAGLLVMATDYECQEYWDNKDKLAEMIAKALGGVKMLIPEEWILTYGTTCPTCDETGQMPGYDRECLTCRGLGKVFMIDLDRGLRDWVYPIRYYSICGGGSCIPRLYCPYCDKGFDGTPHTQALAWDKISFVRQFLTHIENKHPSHPLTEPAWF